jgi:hypothetical protein
VIGSAKKHWKNNKKRAGILLQNKEAFLLFLCSHDYVYMIRENNIF